MGKLNEIQKQTTQSFGDNAFTTTIKDDTVEFDSLKDKFTFKDEVEVPSLKVNGEPVVPQVQSDWNQDDTESVDYIKNKPVIPTPADPIPVKSGTGTNSVLIGGTNVNNATGEFSVAEGNSTTASGRRAHAEGNSTTASGNQSHAEGDNTKSEGYASHAEGSYTTASGASSHAEGNNTKAGGVSSHAEGDNTTASGHQSHAEGFGTNASGSYSHAEGFGTTAGRKNQHVFGKYNVVEAGNVTSEGTYVEIVGNGNNTTRSNARTLDWSGNETLAGSLTIGGASGATLKVESNTLKISFDGGTTWQTVTLS